MESEFVLHFLLDSPSTVRQKIVLPSLKLMSPPDSIKNILTWLQAKMISVVKT